MSQNEDIERIKRRLEADNLSIIRTITMKPMENETEENEDNDSND